MRFKLQKLDIYKLSKGKSKNIKIGELNQDVIDILELDLKPQNINTWSTRIAEHCEKHNKEYSSASNFDQAVSLIPLIIEQPDYVGIHPKNGNIQYIKRLNDISLVGIHIVHNGGLLFRTIFPISEIKLENSIKSGKFLPYKK